MGLIKTDNAAFEVFLNRIGDRTRHYLYKVRKGNILTIVPKEMRDMDMDGQDGIVEEALFESGLWSVLSWGPNHKNMPFKRQGDLADIMKVGMELDDQGIGLVCYDKTGVNKLDQKGKQ